MIASRSPEDRRADLPEGHRNANAAGGGRAPEFEGGGVGSTAARGDELATGDVRAPAATCVPAAVVQAYRAAHYRVLGHPQQAGDAVAVEPALPYVGEVLRIDAPSPWLRAWIAGGACECAALITACNPRGELIDAASNAARTAALERALRAAGHVPLAAAGEDPAGAWPAEASWLVRGLAPASAAALGRAWDQNAIVVSGADGVPRLVLLR
jgi:hypothetical protein